MKKKNEPMARQALNNLNPYSPGRPIWEVQEEFGLARVIKLASNENPLGPSPKSVEVMQQLLPELHRYPDANTYHLRNAIAEIYGILPEQIIVSNGGDELIKLVSETYLEPGDEVIIPAPSFSEYEFAAQLMGAKVVTVHLDLQYQYNIDAILNSVTDRTKLIYICSPNNPTGTYLNKYELLRLLNSLTSDVLVFLDVAYSHYVTAPDYTDGLDFVKEGYPLVLLHTFSKIYGLAGIRVGFGLAPEPIILQMMKVREPFNVNAMAQAGAIAALFDSEHIEASLAINQSGLLFLYNKLNEMGIPHTLSESNFLLIEIGDEAKSVTDKLLVRGIIVRYGGIWGLPRHIRISIGTMDEMETFTSNLREVLN